MNINRKHLILSAAAIIFSLFMVSVALITTADAENYEETAHTVLDSDNVITGMMDDFSKSMIIADGTRYSLCKDVMVYNTADTLIPLNDIEAALKVKLFSNNGCVRKISVLSFAH